MYCERVVRMALIYETPSEYYFRLHHIRSRFKDDVENVLIYMAEGISKLPKMEKRYFIDKLNDAIRSYPGNITKEKKTIDNWRTEISSLFGLVEFDSDSNEYYPGEMAKLLSSNQDLIEFFKYFLFYFQYPGGHIKPHETKNMIQKGIRFKPVKYILSVLKIGEEIVGKRFGINKAEATHCIFNDLRVTRDAIPPEEIVQLLTQNRKSKLDYNWTGDVIRYAGDILDYMLIANLLVQHGSMFYLNLKEQEAIEAFINSEISFKGYEPLYSDTDIPLENIKKLQADWFHFVNHELDPDLFTTDLFEYTEIDKNEYQRLFEEYIGDFYARIGTDGVKTKEIGDFGESLVHGHECMRLKLGDREELIHLVNKIPTYLCVGYDIQSVELDKLKRYIEVKTTVSRKRIHFHKITLTTNEWDAATTLKDRYFVYRLMISKDGNKLFIIQDPVGKYKSDVISMTPNNGAEITFNDNSGSMENLLIWKN